MVIIGTVKRRGIGHSHGQVTHNPKPKTKVEVTVLCCPERGGTLRKKIMGSGQLWTILLLATGGRMFCARGLSLFGASEMGIGRAVYQPFLSFFLSFFLSSKFPYI
jgi:hypothetical protein